METVDIVLEIIEKITGIEKEEMKENIDINLLESGILDSLSIVSLLAEISERIGKRITVKQMKISDFATVTSIAQAIDNIK
ncbi:MAG: phosphopantetheine-binding protein [Firmicutes bacterium]|nr:phosphopantetheine-binding protein [Bacillota bacterium]